MREPDQNPPTLDTSAGATDAGNTPVTPTSVVEIRDEVTEASEDSFPASDAPPWTSSAT